MEYHPNIPLEELTEEEDAQMLELIMRVVEINNQTPSEYLKKQNQKKDIKPPNQFN